MVDEIKELKSVLRALVVSSPTHVDVRSLLRDYRNMMGAPLPAAKYGYRDPLLFLKERFNDSFIFTGMPSNPVLTLIVPDTLKHIDEFVQKQKVASTHKHKGKRRSIPESILKPAEVPKRHPNLIVKSYCQNNTRPLMSITNNSRPLMSATNNTQPLMSATNNSRPLMSTTNNSRPLMSAMNNSRPLLSATNNKPETEVPEIIVKQNELVGAQSRDIADQSRHAVNQTRDSVEHGKQSLENGVDDPVRNFYKKRLPQYNSALYLDTERPPSDKDGTSSKGDDSGRHTSSSSSSTKLLQLEQLKAELAELVAASPAGLWCTDLMRLYRERYKRELNFTRFGFTSIVSLVYVVDALRVSRPDDTGDWLVRDARAAPAPAAGPARRPRAAPPPPAPRAAAPDPDDALPGIEFDPDVFPADCVHFMESIPGMSLAQFAPGAMVEVIVGEVYSPSHFWFIRLGEHYNIAMEDLMDDMTRYYTTGEGRARALARGAVRAGHYCSSAYEGDWHRSLIVKVLDGDTVKVRHVDYGTVDTVAVRELRPLLRRWAALPAQAVRARLAGARPSAAGRRWPRAAAAHFLRRVRDRRLVANVVAVDTEEQAVEVLLIDTSGARDECVAAELVRAGHADARADSALRTTECYLYPRFEALESGDTPNYAEIHAYLRDGIALEYVDAYRRHVPAALPPAGSPPPAPAPPPAAEPPPAAGPTPPAAALTPPSAASSPPADSAVPPAAGPAPEAARVTDRATSPPGAGASVPASPPPPYGAGGAVTLSVAECEVFRMLSTVDPAAAHWYVSAALSRAMAGLRPPHLASPVPFAPPYLAPAHFVPPLLPPPQFTPGPQFRAPPVRLDPAAPEFRMLPPPPIRPPPGF